MANGCPGDLYSGFGILHSPYNPNEVEGIKEFARIKYTVLYNTRITDQNSQKGLPGKDNTKLIKKGQKVKNKKNKSREMRKFA